MNASTPATVFRFPVRVYWEDTDAGGIVFYANYLKFFERARTEWLRALGLGQQRLRDDTGAIFIVSDTSLSYKAPARLDDRLTVTVAPIEIGRASMTIAQQAWREPPEDSGAGAPLLLCEGRIRIGCVDAQRLVPRRFPDEVASRLSPSH